MGNAYALDSATYHGHTQARADIIAATTIEGNLATWDISTVGGTYTVTVKEYDTGRRSQYRTDINGQPTVVIKCSSNCSVSNVAVKSSDGAGGTTTHYTFAADYSSTPRYLVLRLSATAGADGTRLWEAA